MTKLAYDPEKFTLSVLMPVYNERGTIIEAIAAVFASPYSIELVIVDDGSTDGTRDILRSLTDERIHVHFHEKNTGKGGRLAHGHAKGHRRHPHYSGCGPGV